MRSVAHAAAQLRPFAVATQIAAFADLACAQLIQRDADSAGVGALLDGLPWEDPGGAVIAWDAALRAAEPGVFGALDQALADQRQSGAYYTPPAIAAQLAQDLMTPPWPAAPAPICDPAMGGGWLLLAVIAAIAAQGVPAAHAASACYGADLRPTSVAAARLALWVAGGGGVRLAEQLAQQLICGESLLAINWHTRFAAVFSGAQPGFAALITNPPWHSYSGRESQPLDAARRAALGSRYRLFGGWPASHTCFAELGWSLLRGDGRLAIVLPGQVAHLAQYQPLRAHLGTPRVVRELGEGQFAGADTPTLLLVAQRGAPAASAPGWGRPSAARWARIAARSSPLPAAAFGDPGVHTGNMAAQLVVSAPAAGAVPLGVGADITPYHTAVARHWLVVASLPAPGSYWRMSGPARYQQACIVIRQTASHPIAALHDGGVFRNSVLACYGAPPLDVYFLLAVLNARLTHAYWHDHVAESQQRSFPQVKIARLRALPFPRVAFTSAPARRRALVAELHACAATGDAQALHRCVSALADSGISDAPHDLIAGLAAHATAAAAAGDTFALQHASALIDAALEALLGLAYNELAP